MQGMRNMKGYIDSNGNYYEADPHETSDTEVPLRPGPTYDWTGDTWVINPERKALEDEAKARADRERYKELRAAEYPSIYEYLDGIVKGDDEQIKAYLDACRAVKAKFPKPEGVV